MSFGVVAGAVVSAGVGAYSTKSSKKSARNAANAQEQLSREAIALQQRQYDDAVARMNPYINFGQTATAEQMNLLGLNGGGAQQNAIEGIKTSSMFNELNAQGQNAILQNASATGGLRGGNTQAALSQFSPNLLNTLINQRMGYLTNAGSMGLNAANSINNIGFNTGVQQSGQLNQIGAAQAGSYLAEGRANSAMANTIGSAFGYLMGNFGNSSYLPQQQGGSGVDLNSLYPNSGGFFGLTGAKL